MRFAQILFLIFFLLIIECKTKPVVHGFQKIVFHTTQCYGACPVYHLELDNEKSVKLHTELVFKGDIHYPLTDSSRIGFFSGMLSDTLYNKLTNELQTIGIDSLNFNGPNCCDGTIITIIAYYDGKRKYARSMWPPRNVKNLISISYEICEADRFERSAKSLKIEGPEP